MLFYEGELWVMPTTSGINTNFNNENLRNILKICWLNNISNIDSGKKVELIENNLKNNEVWLGEKLRKSNTYVTNEVLDYKVKEKTKQKWRE